MGMRYRCQVRFIHIVGTWMIGQGTNGLSRVTLYERVMNRKCMLLYLPLVELVLKRSYPLGRWIDQWDYEKGRSVKTMYMEVWFVRRYDHDGGEENIDLFQTKTDLFSTHALI